MNDLISRSALLEELKVQRGIERIKGVATINMAIDKGIEIAIRSIVSAPGVDAVEVVRCRDCVHDGLPTCFTCYIEQHKMIFLNHDPEFFCGAGERKAYDERRTE